MDDKEKKRLNPTTTTFHAWVKTFCTTLFHNTFNLISCTQEHQGRGSGGRSRITQRPE